MYKKQKDFGTSINKYTAERGETIENKVKRMVVNKEPINESMKGGIYTERKEGVRPDTNIRTDRFEYAIEGMDIVSKSITAKREERAKMNVIKNNNNNEGEAQSSESVTN